MQVFTEHNRKLLPTVSMYSKFLNIASMRFRLTIDECRDKFGLYTMEQWEQLLNQKN